MREAMYKAIDLNLIHERIMRGKSRVAGAVVAPPLGKAGGVDIAKDKGPWYREIGQGMGAALNTASASNAQAQASAGPARQARSRTRSGEGGVGERRRGWLLLNAQLRHVSERQLKANPSLGGKVVVEIVIGKILAYVLVGSVVAATLIGRTRLPAPMKMINRPPRPLERPPLACISSTIATTSTISCVVASTLRGTHCRRSDIADRMAKTR